MPALMAAAPRQVQRGRRVHMAGVPPVPGSGSPGQATCIAGARWLSLFCCQEGVTPLSHPTQDASDYRYSEAGLRTWRCIWLTGKNCLCVPQTPARNNERTLAAVLRCLALQISCSAASRSTSLESDEGSPTASQAASKKETKGPMPAGLFWRKHRVSTPQGGLFGQDSDSSDEASQQSSAWGQADSAAMETHRVAVSSEEALWHGEEGVLAACSSDWLLAAHAGRSELPAGVF